MAFEELRDKVKEIEDLFRRGNWPIANKKIRKLTRDQSSSGQEAAGLILRASAVSKRDYKLDNDDITLPLAVQNALAALQRGHSATASQMQKLRKDMLKMNEAKGFNQEHRNIYKKVIDMEGKAAQLHHELTVLRAALGAMKAFH